jgi:hypothetical protein
MSDPTKKAHLSDIATSVIAQTEADRLSKLSSEDRKKVLEVTAKMIAAKLRAKSATLTKAGE